MNKRVLRSGKTHIVSDLYLFVLFGMLAVFSMLIVILGARVYRNVVTTTEQNNEIRSSVLYLTNKVRSADQLNSVDAITLDGISVLELSNIYEDNSYHLLIYYYDGSIRELLSENMNEFDPSQGDPITSANSFYIEKNGSLLYFAVTADDGSIYDTHILLQSGQTR
ncbi:MAG: DUF4860 domain-containing protein [Anaerofustis sp.]